MKKTEIVTKFYTAMSKGDWKLLSNLYSKDVVYNDTLFQNLNYFQLTSMWEMLIVRCPNMSVTFKILEAEDDIVKTRWVLVYRQGPKSKRVVISCLSKIKILKDKIINHTEEFDFKNWVKQVYGLKGRLFWNKEWFRTKVISAVLEDLNHYISSKSAEIPIKGKKLKLGKEEKMKKSKINEIDKVKR